MPESFLDELRAREGKEWPAIVKARDAARAEKAKLAELLAFAKDPDLSVVCFGSLAREEWTSKSDLDWTLLIDGQAAPEHQEIALRIEDCLREHKYIEPGPTGIFGNMAFSHPIIHQIGGQDDSNRNTTQRILLLLESTPIGDDSAHRRVVRAILQRYLEEDLTFVKSVGGNTVPRFLLNDIVRYWRTIAVDFAAKQRERGGRGWGLRNAKLRMSRKLTFAAGLLVCFGCHFAQLELLKLELTAEQRLNVWLKFLELLLAQTPLEIIARLSTMFGNTGAAVPLFDSYDRFLTILDDEDKREALKDLKIEDAGASSLFAEVRAMGHTFQDSLTEMLFHTSDDWRKLVLKYGIF